MALPAHSKLSASASSRWTVCPGSIPLSVGASDKASFAALEGTALHAVMEKCLLQGIDAADVPEITIVERGEKHTFELNDEQHEAVQVVLDKARSLVATDGTLMTETKVLYGRAINQPDAEAFGTVDIAIVNGKHLHIVDAKFGRRFVDPVENTQMLLYGIGMLDTIELLEDRMEQVTMHISQPRLAGGSAEGWTQNREQMDDWIEFFHKAADRVAQASAQPMTQQWQDKYLKPTEEGCHFCRAAAHCPALRRLNEGMIANAVEAADPADFEVIVSDKLQDFDISEILKQAPLVRRFLDAVEAKAMSDLLDGKQVEGYKLIEGRQGNRKWGDEDAAEEAFADLGTSRYSKPKLLTPAQMVKAIREVKGMSKADAENEVNQMTVRDPAKPSMVPENQPGKPWSAGADFEIVN